MKISFNLLYRARIPIGLSFLVLDVFVLYYKRDIIRELINGRPIDQLDIFGLVFPILLLLFSILLLRWKIKNTAK